MPSNSPTSNQNLATASPPGASFEGDPAQSEGEERAVVESRENVSDMGGVAYLGVFRQWLPF